MKRKTGNLIVREHNRSLLYQYVAVVHGVFNELAGIKESLHCVVFGTIVLRGRARKVIEKVVIVKEMSTCSEMGDWQLVTYIVQRREDFGTGYNYLTMLPIPRSCEPLGN